MKYYTMEYLRTPQAVRAIPLNLFIQFISLI